MIALTGAGRSISAFIIRIRYKCARSHVPLQLEATVATPCGHHVADALLHITLAKSRRASGELCNFTTTHAFRTVGAAVLVQVVGPCFDELNVRPGCECSTRACKAAIQPLVTQTCKRAILKIICDVADWLEPQLEANVRSMYLHVFNDCALGAQEGCNAVRSRPAQTALHR